MNKIHEECGVFGVFAKEKSNVAATAYYGLFALQHRGQESCGIVVNLSLIHISRAHGMQNMRSSYRRSGDL